MLSNCFSSQKCVTLNTTQLNTFRVIIKKSFIWVLSKKRLQIIILQSVFTENEVKTITDARYVLAAWNLDEFYFINRFVWIWLFEFVFKKSVFFYQRFLFVGFSPIYICQKQTVYTEKLCRTFYEQLLRMQIPKLQKDTDDLTVFLCFWDLLI